ncbi:MAG: dethiobiotin synthase [Candidatus Wenzhouxiangella sp. M2_3B_020]
MADEGWHYIAPSPSAGATRTRPITANRPERTVFVTGTDTGCGKTTATALLARRLASRHRRVACFKPIASGCRVESGRLVSDDAVELMRAMNVQLGHEQVNPYRLEPPIAPHIAARKVDISFDLDMICNEIQGTACDIALVEGVGGWLVPLGDERLLPELPRRLDAQALLVVGMRLGCLNHALLTARAIAEDGVSLAGWIANYLDPEFAEPDANERTLERLLPAPLLGRIRDGRDGPLLEMTGEDAEGLLA